MIPGYTHGCYVTKLLVMLVKLSYILYTAPVSC